MTVSPNPLLYYAAIKKSTYLCYIGGHCSYHLPYQGIRYLKLLLIITLATAFLGQKEPQCVDFMQSLEARGLKLTLDNGTEIVEGLPDIPK